MSETGAPRKKYTARRESWGRLRKLPSGRYQASYVGPDGEAYNGPQTFSTKTDGRAWLSERRREIEQGRWRSPRVIEASTFGKYAVKWVDQRTSSSGAPLRPKTRAEYLRQLEKGLQRFSDVPLSRITAGMVREWHRERAAGAATAAAREAALLKAVLATALEDDLVDRNPVPRNLTSSSAGKKYRPPTPEELAALVAYFGEHKPEWQLSLYLAAFGGLRLSEWRALRRRDVTATEGRFSVTVERQAYVTPPRLRKGEGVEWTVGDPKSAEGVRTVTLPAQLTPLVERHLAEHVERFADSLLFAPLSGDFLRDDAFARVWRAASDVAGTRGQVREHDLRAFAATYYTRGGATLREVMAFLGHSSTNAAMRYQHAVGDRVTELADAMPVLPEPVARVVGIDEKRGGSK